MILTFVLRIDL